MDGAPRLGDHVADGFACAGATVQDAGVGREVGEKAGDEALEAGVVAEEVFVALTEVVEEEFAAWGGGVWEVGWSHFYDFASKELDARFGIGRCFGRRCKG